MVVGRPAAPVAGSEIHKPYYLVHFLLFIPHRSSCLNLIYIILHKHAQRLVSLGVYIYFQVDRLGPSTPSLHLSPQAGFGLL